MSLKNAIDKLKYDSRMVDINLKSQILNTQDIKKHLDHLPDLQANCTSLDIEAEITDDSMSLNGHAN